MDYLSLIQRPFYTVKTNPATKSVVGAGPLDDFWYSTPHNDDDPSATDLLKAVPWLWRSVELRANAVASMPFQIMRGDTVIDTSGDEYTNALGWLPNPARLLYLTEAALACWGTAYWWREQNRVAIKAVRYVHPATIEPIIDSQRGLTGFYRTINGYRKQIPVEALAYFWRPDAEVELGPPLGSPVMAAVAASGVLRNLDKFSSAYFARGAIKATLLTVSGAPIKAERDRLKDWWRDLVSGIRNAFATEIVNADSVTPVVIGEGLKELSNATLTSEKRQDIATSMGVPLTMIFSESARGLGGEGVASEDEKKFYTTTIIPECVLVASVVNEQLLEPMGYRLSFLPETLDAFQEDETQRAAAFASYVNSGLPVEVVGPMLGVELPEGWTWEQIAALKEQRRQEMADAMQDNSNNQPPDNSQDNAKTVDDLRKWRRKSDKRGKLADFESDWIPLAVMDEIKAHGTNGWRDALDDVIVSYTGDEDDRREPVPVAVPDTTELVAALRSATEAVLNGHARAE